MSLYLTCLPRTLRITSGNLPLAIPKKPNRAYRKHHLHSVNNRCDATWTNNNRQMCRLEIVVDMTVDWTVKVIKRFLIIFVIKFVSVELGDCGTIRDHALSRSSRSSFISRYIASHRLHRIARLMPHNTNNPLIS